MISDRIKENLIGLIVPSLEGGGGVPAVARFILDVAQRSGYRVKLISLATSSTDAQSTSLRSPASWARGVTVRTGKWHGTELVHVGTAWTDFEFQRYKPRKALAEAISECDLLQVVSGFPAWANSVVGLGKPVALHVATMAKVERRRRDANPSGISGWWRKGMTNMTDRLDDRALCSVDAVQLMNPWMMKYAKELNIHRTSVDLRYAPPGVDAQLFRPKIKQRLTANPYILCVGRLADTRKNINLLLSAFRALPDILGHVQLLTAGSSSPSPEYWEQVYAMGLEKRVRHLHRPSTAELVSVYQNAAVFALTSDEEGFGMVIVEAMACAVPVVATRSGGPDGIITDGKDGFLVPLSDSSAIAERLTLLCTDSARNIGMGLQGRATIEARYSVEVAGMQFVNMWEALLGMVEVRNKGALPSRRLNLE